MRTHRARRGFALAMAMMAIVVIGAIIAGVFFASTQDYRIGRNTLVEQRSFTVAEFGLNKEVGNWDRTRNLAPPAGLPIGTVVDTNVYVANDDTARVRITRLNRNTYWVVSEGRASIGNAQTASLRRTNSIVRLAYPYMNFRGAMTTAGDVTMHGAATITGNDTKDANLNAWTQCPSIGSDSLAGIVAMPTAKIDSSSRITGTPSITRAAYAGDTSTYLRWGGETWQTLVDNADITLDAAADPFPVDSMGRCDTNGPQHNTNWGEPFRGVGTAAACYNYFPIIYVKNSVTLNGNGRGQGILIIDGDLQINGTFDFYGIIVVRNDVMRGNGTARIHGAVMSRNADLGTGSVFTGTQDVMYSKCAVESALSASAILVQTRDRAWAQLF
jgi:hypothetical protein